MWIPTRACHGSIYRRRRGRIAVLMGMGVQVLLCLAGARTSARRHVLI